ncbi:hypothetical protein GCM10010236_47950 [Streptomyces eurythermus]|nr:hypothetical protein GCM10010236_47950 [Streptomyces eurythermus]
MRWSGSRPSPAPTRRRTPCGTGSPAPWRPTRSSPAGCGPPCSRPRLRPRPAMAIHIGGNADRSTIVIGPVQLPRTKGVMAALVAGVVVLAVLLVIGFRTVLHGVTGDDGGGGGSGDARRVAALKDSATAEAVLPDSGSLPAGWEVTEAAKVTEGVPDDCSTACEGAAFTATVRYENERPLAGAFFYVQAYPRRAALRGLPGDHRHERLLVHVPALDGGRERGLPEGNRQRRARGGGGARRDGRHLGDLPDGQR